MLETQNSWKYLKKKLQLFVFFTHTKNLLLKFLGIHLLEPNFLVYCNFAHKNIHSTQNYTLITAHFLKRCYGSLIEILQVAQKKIRQLESPANWCVCCWHYTKKNFFGKCDQIHSFLRIWSHLLKKSLMGNFIFVQCGVSTLHLFPLEL